MTFIVYAYNMTIGALLDRIIVAEKSCEQLHQESLAWKELSIAKIQKGVEEKLQGLYEDIAEDKQSIVSLQHFMWESIYLVSKIPGRLSMMNNE